MSDPPPAPEPETLGTYIKTARKAAGLSLATLAGRVGVSAQAVHQWEADAATPTPRALHFLARELPALEPRKLLALIPSGTR